MTTSQVNKSQSDDEDQFARVPSDLVGSREGGNIGGAAAVDNNQAVIQQDQMIADVAGSVNGSQGPAGENEMENDYNDQ